MQDKKVLIGISGGIAAYKSLTLIRLFKKSGWDVKVVSTRNALSFVTPLTIETLSNNTLYVDMFENPAERHTEHISLAQWADVMVVAPATANIIGKLTNGIADDALSTTLLAFTKPVYIAPAMNENMYNHFSVQKNLETLRQNSYRIIKPESGTLACNTEGVGRMAEPETIFERVINDFTSNNTSPKKRALVTAGPTYEPIDPVRFIGNRSSGLMGFSLAEALAEQGFEVDLITGPTRLQTDSSYIHRVDVNTAEEMLEACLEYYKEADVIIMSAAVADYTPKEKNNSKLKKKETSLSLELKPTEDILKTIASKKAKNQLVVGFALETDNEFENAKKKLHTKNLDFIVLNSLNDKGAGFETPTNKVTLINKNDIVTEFPMQSKQETAKGIIKAILKD